jgi:hypothetical protein|tara:strand:+ start:10168 stop:11142 length:975 start_codon:yes stop_codon:yes gene_type:complete
VLLHKDKEALEEAIRATAQHLSLPIEYVEKDYWVTYALKELASSSIGEHIVFKGGTSLSKAYSLISRFSEDIDIAVLTEGLLPSQTKKRVRRASKIIGETFEEIDSPDNSKGSDFRKVRFQYPRMDSSAPVEGQITDSLLLEVNAFADPEPYNKMPLSSYIADFFNSSGQESAVTDFALEEFEMNVLCKTRTVCEKVMGLVKASYGDDHINQINNKIRHLYDIHFLLTDNVTCKFVESAEFCNMTEKVMACDRKASPSAPWLDIPLADACVFSSLRDIWPALEGTYNGDFKAMIVGEDIPSMELLVESMSIIHKQLVKLDDSLK